MKKNFKKIVPFLFLPLLFLMMNCQIEEDVTDKHNRSHIKITDQTFDELILKKEFNNAFSKIPKMTGTITSSLQGRTVMEEQYGFTIADQPAKVIDLDNKTSYTFLITRENQDDAFFENLIVEVDSTNQTKAFIVKYIPTAPLNLTLKNKVDFQGNVEVTPLIYNSSTSMTGKSAHYCFDAIGSLCSGIPYDCGGTVCGVGIVSMCSEIHGGSGGGGGGSGSGGVGGGGSGAGSGDSSSPDPEVSTVIVPPVEEGVIPSQTQPCKELIKLSKFHPAKVKLMELVSRTNDEKEFGFAFKKSPTTNAYQLPVVIPNDANNPDRLSGNDYVGGDYIGIFHTHPNPTYGQYPMFSDDDLKTLCNLARKHVIPAGQIKNYSEYVLTLTTYNGTFAIKIKDVTKFFSAINDPAKFKEIGETLLKKYRKRDPTDSINGFKKDLLNLFKEFDMGAGLYEANADFTQWKEVTLDPANPDNIPVLTPCN